MKQRSLLLFIISCALLVACNRPQRPRPLSGSHYVEVREQSGQYQLYRNGAPYFVKGAGIYDHFNKLKESGGNSIRIYNVDSDSALAILDQAHQQGLTVTVGLNIAYAGDLDYSDEKASAAQLQRLKKDVLRLKDHPALLMWGIGNELNLKIKNKSFPEHYRLWRAVNDIAKMVHALDPHHPTTTMIPSSPHQTIRYISLLCDEIDILSINVFRNYTDLPQMIAGRGWQGPYMVSEYGAYGHWNAPRTDWYAKIEPTSQSKAQLIQKQYYQLIEAHPGKCLGSYAFIWGQKQEYTTTWFSLFTDRGQPTEMIDALQYVWTNKWPANRAPSIHSLLLNQQKDSANIYLKAGKKFTATLRTQDLENDDLQLSWEIQKDNVEIYFDPTVGQNKTEIIAKGEVALRDLAKAGSARDAASQLHQYHFQFNAPPDEGPYRLFMYVSDEHKKSATGNASFYVYHK